MPNYSSSSVDVVDWAMSVDTCHTVKKRNLLDDIQILPDTPASTPIPPPFQDFITLINTKQRSHTSLSIDSIEHSSSLPHQIPSPLLDHSTYKYGKIRARPLSNFKYSQSNIWTQSSANQFSIDIDLVNKYFAKESKQLTVRTRSRTTSSISQPFQILDKSSQIAYDVTMRHLLQIFSKSSQQTATIDDILHDINTGSINSECLQCVQRLYKTLTKQFIKRPEDKNKFETYPLANVHQLNRVEEFFVKLFHLPNYNFKLKSYHYRDEYQSQLNVLSQSIDRLLQGIDFILHDQFLPKICQVLCFLYNSLSNQSVPGLDFISLVDALSTPTNQVNKTFSHVLVEILNEFYQTDLIEFIHNEKLIDLKKILSIKYEKIYQEIRDIYQQYQQLQYEYSFLKNQYDLPDFLSAMLTDAKVQFDKLFQQEYLLKQGEENLANYFCSNDLSLDVCLSTIGEFINKLRLAYNENEKHQQICRLNSNRKRSVSALYNSTSSFLAFI